MQDIESIYKEYFETVYKYLLCMTNNSDISEELTQETFYKAVQKINTYKGTCKISVWLCQIAKNLWYDQCRKNKKQVYVDDTFFNTIEDPEEIEKDVISKEEKINLYEKIEKLDETTREVVRLRINGELTFKEIGNILNKSENLARVTFYRGKQKLMEKEVD